MKGKWTVLVLLVCLGAFGYLFVLNPTLVNFRFFRGAPVRANLALVVFLSFLTGFGVAFLAGLGKEVFLSLRFWHHGKGEARREKGRRLFSVGRGLLAVAKPKAAGKALRQAYRRLPGDSSVAIDLARAEAGQGQVGAAETRLKALLEDDSGNVEALSLLLDVQLRRGDVEGQRATLARWLELDPGHLPALRALRDLYRKGERWPEAIRVQEKVLAKADGREARAPERRLLSELLVLSAKGAEQAGAQAQLKRAVDEDREYAPGYAALGDSLVALNDLEGACRVWLRGYDATGQAGLLLQVEGIRLRQGRGEEMLKVYRKLEKKERTSTLLRARLLISLDRADEALDLLEKLEGPVGGSVAADWLTGEALFRLRSFERSARALRRSAGEEGDAPSIPFSCSVCGSPARQWKSSCPVCGAMDTLRLKLGRSLSSLRPAM